MKITCLSKGGKKLFTQIPNEVIDDSSLSLAAHRILMIGLRLPPKVNATRALLAEKSKLSTATITRTLRELRLAGYVMWEQPTKDHPRGLMVFADYPAFLEEGSVTSAEGRVITSDEGGESSVTRGVITSDEAPSIYLDLSNTLSNTLCNTEQPNGCGGAKPEQWQIEGVGELLGVAEPIQQPEILNRSDSDEHQAWPSDRIGVEDPSPSSLVGQAAKRIGSDWISSPPPFEDLHARTMLFAQLNGIGWPRSSTMVHFFFDHHDYWHEIVADRKNRRIVYQPAIVAQVIEHLSTTSRFRDRRPTELDARDWLDARLVLTRDDCASALTSQVDRLRLKANKASAYSTAAVALDPNEEYFPWNP